MRINIQISRIRLGKLPILKRMVLIEKEYM